MRSQLRTLLGSAALLAAVAACAAPAQPAPAAAQPAASGAQSAASGAPPAAGSAAPASAPASAPAASTPRVTPLSPPITVTVGSSTAELPYGSIVALERGYFQELGIELDFQGRVGDSAAAMTAAAANNLDVASAATGPALFNSAARGIDLSIVAANGEITRDDRSQCWVARKDLIESGQVKSPADFKGLRVAGQAQGVGSSNDVYLAKTLAPYGLTYADVDEISMEFGSINQAMSNRAIDIGWQIEPLMTLGIEQGLYDRTSCTGEFYPGYQVTFLFYSPHFAENTQAARNFIYAHLKGTREYDDALYRDVNRDQIVEMLMKNTAVKDRPLWDKMARRWYSPTGRIDTAILSSDQDYYVQRGFLNQTVDVSKLVNTAFIDYANAALGEYTVRP
ncbi:MAG TPA: ABC transporter substrate-binding protein [Chloroflexota bacterium]|jgi:NitT/TauT family transport system substrate-binding protein